MIVRVIVIDPKPRDPRDDVVVYQVPEKSRAHELLIDILDRVGLEHVVIDSVPSEKRRRNAP